MTANELREFVDNNISTLFVAGSYKSYLRRDNKLHGLDFINRFLIHFQHYIATDVKSELDWASVGRVLRTIVNQEVTPIYLLIPSYNVFYTLKSTNELIKNGEMTTGELNEAIKRGIVEKNRVISDYSSAPVYDITDTVIVDGELNKEYLDKYKKPKIKLSYLMDACKTLSNIDIEAADKTFYNKSSNILFLNSESDLHEKIKHLINALCISLWLRVTNEYSIYTGNFKGWEQDGTDMLQISSKSFNLLVKSMEYSLLSYISNKFTGDIEFDDIREFYCEYSKNQDTLIKLFSLMDLLETLINIVISYINEEEKQPDIVRQVEIMQKADNMLTILEAHEAMKKIKGEI